MPPKTKSGTDKPLIGQPSMVLREEFLLANQESRCDENILPFKGPLQLPSNEQVLKLYFYYREQVGSNNQHVTPGSIALRVAKQVVKYWNMAGFQTMVMPRVESHVLKQLKIYQAMNKNRARTSQTEITKREQYLRDLNKLFDIARQNLEDLLEKDRLLAADDKDKR